MKITLYSKNLDELHVAEVTHVTMFDEDVLFSTFFIDKQEQQNFINVCILNFIKITVQGGNVSVCKKQTVTFKYRFDK